MRLSTSSRRAGALTALLLCAACAEGKTSSFVQAPIFFGNAGQGSGTAPVVEPDGANYAALGGNALLPTAAPAPATPLPQPVPLAAAGATPAASVALNGPGAPVAAVTAQVSPTPVQGVAQTATSPSAALNVIAGGNGVTTTVQTPGAGVAAQVGLAPVTQALPPALAAPVAALPNVPVTVAVAAAPVTGTVNTAAGAALTTAGGLLGGTNPLATTTAAVTTPATNLITNTATTARRGACVLHIVC